MQRRRSTTSRLGCGKCAPLSKFYVLSFKLKLHVFYTRTFCQQLHVCLIITSFHLSEKLALTEVTLVPDFIFPVREVGLHFFAHRVDHMKSWPSLLYSPNRPSRKLPYLSPSPSWLQPEVGMGPLTVCEHFLHIGCGVDFFYIIRLGLSVEQCSNVLNNLSKKRKKGKLSGHGGDMICVRHENSRTHHTTARDLNPSAHLILMSHCRHILHAPPLGHGLLRSAEVIRRSHQHSLYAFYQEAVEMYTRNNLWDLAYKVPGGLRGNTLLCKKGWAIDLLGSHQS